MTDGSVRSGPVRIDFRITGSEDAVPVLLVHGFPDTRAVWEPVASRFVSRGLQVVTYDVRGAGRSAAPPDRSGYRVEHLVDDLVAVLDEAVPRGGVHLVGHDWGSVQLWAALTGHHRVRDRAATFTSISGPPLEQLGCFLRTNARSRDWRAVLDQLRRSWYIAAFQVPVLPEWTFRTFAHRIRAGMVRSQHLDADHWEDTFAADAAHGVNLYRANAVRDARGRPEPVEVPVQLVVPRHDAFLSPAIYADLTRVAPDLTRLEVEAGHWVPQSHPVMIADLVEQFVRAHAR